MLIRMTDQRSKPGKEKHEDEDKKIWMGQWIRGPGVAEQLLRVMLPGRLTWKD